MSTVSSSEFKRNPGLYHDKALTEPVTIVEDGREQLVLLSMDEYRRLTRRTRRAVASDELPDRDLAAIENSEMSPEHSALDGELKGWRPGFLPPRLFAQSPARRD